ncbi:MAG: hypothetical protein LBU17_04610 [Treponema sp.]|jgi:hypothetical protein|nr:hypothetical protein [Treponema sp.]
MMKIIEDTSASRLPAMSDERIAELQNFQTKDFSDCPIQTPEQLQQFRPRYPDESMPCKLEQGAPVKHDIAAFSKHGVSQSLG